MLSRLHAFYVFLWSALSVIHLADEPTKALEGNSIAQTHRAGEWQRRDSDPGRMPASPERSVWVE